MMKRLVYLAIIAILLVFLLALPSSAATSYVYDPDGHLSESDRDAVELYLVNLNNGSYISYYLVVSDYESDAYKHSYGDTVTLWVDPVGYSGTYEYEIIVYGYANTEMSYRESDLILDDSDVYNNIKSGNIRAGALRAFELADTAVHGDLRAENWLLKTILTSLVIAVVISAIACGIIIYKYKKKLKSPIYPLDRYARLDLIPANSRDIFLHKTLTRVRINTSSGSGGSGGRSGGGGSRGRR